MKKKNKPFFSPLRTGVLCLKSLALIRYSVYHEMLATWPILSLILQLTQDHIPSYYDKPKDRVICPPACIYTDHTAEWS